MWLGSACRTREPSGSTSKPLGLGPFAQHLATAAPEYDQRMKLLERERFLDQLAASLIECGRGRGGLVLVSGEAGAGKTALVEAFCESRAVGVPILWGSCDAVLPARPFAPLTDIADKVDQALQGALDAANRDRVFEAFLALLRQPPAAPGVVVFEDLHWADDATLDVLRVVGRRLRDLSVLFIGTYRDQEVGGEHPLRLALGDVPADVVTEIRVPSLSVGAVAALAEGSGMDAASIHRATAGNPFYVTEVLAAGGEEVPAAVSDAVLARVARLTPSARSLLQAASVLGERFPPALVRELANGDTGALAECLARGLLQAEGDVLRFRHELAQRAIREALSPSERIRLHTRALAALRHGAAEPARLAHHAVEAGDGLAVIELAPLAATRAGSLGAHREAAAHYAAALRFASGLEDRSRAELLEGYGRECLVIDDVDTALASQYEALECWRRRGDVSREASCLSGLSLMLWVGGEGEGAIEYAERAVELLESISAPESELAPAYGTLAQRHMARGGEDALALALAERAHALAERVDDELTAVHALTTIGVAEIFLGMDRGWARLDESVRRARAAGLREEVSRALINVVEAARDTKRYELVDRYRDEALASVSDEDPEHDLYRRRLLSCLAELALDRGHWDDAAQLAGGLRRERRSASLVRVTALIVLGRVQARRGERDAWSLLDEALALAGPRGERAELCPLYAARAEAALLADDTTQARREAETGLVFAAEATPDPWWQGELGFWTWKAGGGEQLPAGSAEPYLLHASGRYHEAARSWEAIGCPYHRALALADTHEEDDLRQALAIFQALGAEPMARQVTKRLRSLGARNVPRGPRAATRSNPGGLTAREFEVLALLGEGMRNADIAARLVVSEKTVDHHVSAVLRKLGVPNRAAAAEEAARLGLKDREIAAAE